MRIGFDIDGVLADFPKAYQELYVELTGENKFLEGDAKNPPDWDWDLLRGYTKAQRREIWDNIVLSNTFYRELEPLPGVKALDPLFPAIEDLHDVYFITSRGGKTVKRQSEDWIKRYLGYEERFGCSQYSPTVLITSSAEGKAQTAKALNLTVYIDDKWDNAEAIKNAVPKCRVYLLDRRYNRHRFDSWTHNGKILSVIRVHSVQEFVEQELDNL